METDLIISRLKERHNITSLKPMQQQLAATDSREIILLAPTGSGKTIAFTIRMLRALGKPDGKVLGVIIAPSRELVIQIADVIRPVAAGLKTVAFYGGHSMTDEVNSLSVTPDIIVATPGRLLDHLKRQTLSLTDVKALVLDEYDKSLELGFQDEMRRIVKKMGHPRLVILTSATKLTELPPFLTMKSPETLDFTSTGRTASGRLQTVRVDSPERDKLPTLDLLLRSLDNGKVLVFVNHRESAERVYDYLKKEGFPVGLYHGGLEQRERKLAIDLLNNSTTPILVTTDLGARGLDIDNVEDVIHYHMPLSMESWTHRNGRTARNGADGTAYTIIADGENIPEYVTWQRELQPRGNSTDPIRSDLTTIYINAGKKEKISKGDIAGYLIHKGGLQPDQIGRIIVDDHHSIVAIPTPLLTATLANLAPHKLKNTRVKLSPIR